MWLHADRNFSSFYTLCFSVSLSNSKHPSLSFGPLCTLSLLQLATEAIYTLLHLLELGPAGSAVFDFRLSFVVLSRRACGTKQKMLACEMLFG